jgi:hypothetical protein
MKGLGISVYGGLLIFVHHFLSQKTDLGSYLGIAGVETVGANLFWSQIGFDQLPSTEPRSSDPFPLAYDLASSHPTQGPRGNGQSGRERETSGF